MHVLFSKHRFKQQERKMLGFGFCAQFHLCLLQQKNKTKKMDFPYLKANNTYWPPFAKIINN